MPRCEGRPDGPCPHKVNNSTVINCQSKKRDAKRNAPATRSSANSDRSTKEETLVKPVNSSKHSAVDCIVCREDADEVHISCDICNDCYHKHCSGLPADVFDTLLTIVSSAGWVCSGCHASSHSRCHYMLTES